MKSEVITFSFVDRYILGLVWDTGTPPKKQLDVDRAFLELGVGASRFEDMISESGKFPEKMK